MGKMPVKNNIERKPALQDRSATHFRGLLRLITIACALLILIGLLRRPQRDATVSTESPRGRTGAAEPSGVSRPARTRCDSLRPGMVYVGGTDNGRWVPELLNETSGLDPHIIVTQNAFADSRYIEYMQTLYGERFSPLTSEDSQRAFQEYVTDAQRRLEHDQQFPNEPKQVRPGEAIRILDVKVQVSGQVAVMTINEKLLQTLMQKNPDLAFAMQESFPMRGTYADALPLGPLMELRALDGQNGFTPERAAQSLDYWRSTAQQLLSDPEANGSPAALKSYSHDAVS